MRSLHLRRFATAATDFIHDHLLICLLICYALAALVPGFGLSLRMISFHPAGLRSGVSLSLLELLLAFLLFDAGTAFDIRALSKIIRHPKTLLLGILLNFLLPISFGVLVKTIGHFWHNPNEVQVFLVGLALIASMPIAGSSTAWAQNSRGNLGLSLGLVVISTVLSPILTPLILGIFGKLTQGDLSEDLREIARSGSTSFLVISVVIPALLGMGVKYFMPERLARFKRVLQSLNRIDLLLLNYSNAASALPQVFAAPDYDFLIVSLTLVIILCGFAFLTGWWVGHRARLGLADRVSLMYGLGMNNNGTGLVLANKHLGDHLMIIVPVILYNLVQQIAAGIVDRKLSFDDRRK